MKTYFGDGDGSIDRLPASLWGQGSAIRSGKAGCRKALSLSAIMSVTLALCGTAPVKAQGADAVVAPVAGTDALLEKDLKTQAEASDVPAPFAGLGFGVGISLTIDTGKHDRIEDASIVNGKVRINKDSNTVPRLLLETHYFFTPEGHLLGLSSLGLRNTTKNADGTPVSDASRHHVRWGHGPFVAVQAGSGDSVINAVGFGWMVGFKRNDQATSSSSFNVGIGYIVDPSVKVLGDDFRVNKAPPPGESMVRYRTTAQGGLLLMTSFSF